MTIYYIDNPAAGAQDGSNWDNAAPIANITTLYAACQPGDQIWVNSLVTHTKTGTTVWTNANGATEDSPITVRGMRKSGTVQGFPEKAMITGARTLPWPATGGAQAGTLFRLSTGVNHMRIRDLVVMNYERGIQYFDATAGDGIIVEDVDFVSVDDGITTGVTGDMSGLRVRRCNVVGHSGRAFNVGGTQNDIIFEDCATYTLGQDDNDTGTAALGFMADVSAYNIRFRRCKAIGGIDIRPDANYWQGDGFIAEEGVYDIEWEECYAADWADGGWDTKGSGGILRRCVSERNMRNYRFHYQRVPGYATAHIAEDCVSRYPRYRGGSGSAAHIQMAAGTVTYANTLNWYSTVGRSLFEDHDPDTPITAITAGYSSATITDALIRKHTDALLGDHATFTNCVTEDED